MLTRFLRGLALLALLALPPRAPGTESASVQETTAALIDRLLTELRPYELRRVSEREVERLLTPEERRILGTEHITFRVNVPITVFVVRGASPKSDPFWLREQSFIRSTNQWIIDKAELEIWEREFDAGEIGLGINSFVGGGTHYVVVLAPKYPGDAVIVTDLDPPNLSSTNLHAGVKIYADRDDTFPNIPPQFAGYTLVQTCYAMRDDARVRDLFRWTDHPAGDRPDQIVLTWSGDPRTTQTIQWRTSERVRHGYVRYSKKADLTNSRIQPITVRAKTERLYTRFIVNNPVMRHHTATLTNLEPGATYRYSVGDGSARNWSSPAEFTTAPAASEPFSFIYMGDAQNGLYRWGSLLRRASRLNPEAAFYLVAGDLVNRGHERHDWDNFFYNARGVFSRRTFIPVIGNHDCLGGHPTLYLNFFDLPQNGPPKIEPERAYAFEYSNSLFVVLDSNLEPETQTAWLEEQLSSSSAFWKFVTFHHPAFSSAPERDNKKLREMWTPIFEKHGVDLVLQGHDHAYMRTHPLKNGVITPTASNIPNAPIYLVAVSGTKMYEQSKVPYSAVAFTNVPTYQVFQVHSNRLTYRAYDINGLIRDQFNLQK